MGSRLLGVLAVLICVLQAAAAQSPLRDEARRRNEALVRQGYNYTQGASVRGAERFLRTQLIVPPHGDEEHQLTLWAAAENGEVELRLLSADAEVLLSLRGRSVETTVSRTLRAGTYTLEFSASHPEGGQAVVGLRGPTMGVCRPAPDRLVERPADPAHGYAWPYLLHTPRAAPRGLLVVPLNTGFVSADLGFLRAAAACEVQHQASLAERLGAALLVPLFPRPEAPGEAGNLYLHALVRAALAVDGGPHARVDLQLGAMVDDARRHLARQGATLPERSLFLGFSASGSFVQRYALLHPDRVLAVAAGSPGGWPTVPVGEDGGEALPYPVGVSDLQALIGRTLDLAALRQVPHFFFLGADDRNDAVPFRDSFDRADEALVLRRFGKLAAERWPAAERLYRQQLPDARFRLYPGVAHMVSPAMEADIEAFFVEALRKHEGPDAPGVPGPGRGSPERAPARRTPLGPP